MSKVIPITGQIQNYQWGGFDYLSSLLACDSSQQYSQKNPQAEYWLGAHPSAPAQTLTGDDTMSITDLLFSHNCELNFLLKILDVREMLSIQVHPNKAEAQAGFDRENALGIELSAKNRNYKDANHKPELLVALSEFWLLHGFKSESDIVASLHSYSYLEPLLNVLNQRGLASAFEWILDSHDESVARMSQQLQTDFTTREPIADKFAIEFWIQRWLNDNPNTLTGLLTLFFMNLVKLDPGAAMYQPSGLLHAYLEGQNIELMANSDNVLRAGLTPKHIDIKELLQVCTIEPSNPNDFLISPVVENPVEQRFPTPFTEFELSVLQPTDIADFVLSTRSVEILLALEGAATVVSDSRSSLLVRGQALLLLPGAQVSVHFDEKNTRIFRAKNL